MKKLVFVFIGLILVNCATKKEQPKMAGAYNILSYTVKGDSVDNGSTERTQSKIYTGDLMMYAGYNPADSTASFGVGSYTTEPGTVVENIVFNASSTAANAAPGTFKLAVEQNPKGYKQVIEDMPAGDQKFTLTEEYETVSEAKSSPLDGVWKLEKIYGIKGTDTTTWSTTEYKAYAAGHFIWGNTYVDSLQVRHSGVGFGVFNMDGDKVKETVNGSNYGSIVGQDFDISIQLNGADGFRQSRTDSEGITTVEEYTRLKK